MTFVIFIPLFMEREDGGKCYECQVSLVGGLVSRSRIRCFLRLSGKQGRKMPHSASCVAAKQLDHIGASLAESTLGPERL